MTTGTPAAIGALGRVLLKGAEARRATRQALCSCHMRATWTRAGANSTILTRCWTVRKVVTLVKCTTCTCYECWSADKKNGSVDSFKMHQGKMSRARRLCEGVRPCGYLFFFNAYCRCVDSFQRKKNHIEQNSQQKIQFRRDAQVQDGPLAWLLE